MSEIFKWLWSNPTRATGVAAYGVALACCVFCLEPGKG